MAMTTAQKTDMYRFFSIAFNAAPGVTYMNQLDAAVNSGMSTKQIVNVFTLKDQFTSVYPTFLDNATFATRLVDAVVGTSAAASDKAQAVIEIVAGIASGMTRGDIVYQIFTNLAAKAPNDAAWGATAKLMANKVAVAAYYTEELATDSTDLAALRAVLANVTAATDVSTNSAMATAISSAVSGQTFTLTTGADLYAGTAGADIIRGVAGTVVGAQDQTTLNSSDVLNGGAGDKDLLVINMTGPAYNGGATIKGFETLQIGSNQALTNFDYNVNAGAYEVTGVNTVVYDQITRGEVLNVINVTPTSSLINPMPTLSWENEAGSAAGTAGVTFRQASISGTADNQQVNLKNINAMVAGDGILNIAGGVETITINSTGAVSANTLNNAALANQDTTVFSAPADVVSAGTLKKVVLTGNVAIGQVGSVVATATNASYGLTDRLVGVDTGLTTDATGNVTESNLLSVGARVTEVDASTATAGVNVRFVARTDSVATDVVFKGSEGKDYVEFEVGNINATGGAGDDTFAFVNTTTSNATFTTADAIVGGAGADTIQLGVNGAGTFNLDTTEFNNKSGIDVLDLRGQINTIKLSDAFVTSSDAGLTVRTDKIIQTSATSSANDAVTTTNNVAEDRSVNTIDLTALAANRAVVVMGGSGSDRLLVNEVSLNSAVTFTGGTNVANTLGAVAGAADYDTLTVVNSAVLSRGDLVNISGIEGIVLTKNTTGINAFVIELTEAFVLANTASSNSGATSVDDRILQITTAAAANGTVLQATDTIRIDVTDLYDTTTNALKSTLVGRQIDTTGVAATVSYTYKGLDYATLAAIPVTANTALAGNDAARADVNASGAAVSVAPVVAQINLTSTAAIITANATALTGGAATTDTLTVTDAGTVTVGSVTTALETLVLANGTNTVAFNQAGFTNVTGGTGSDAVSLANLALTASVNLGAGTDTLTVVGVRTGTFVGGDGADTMSLLAAANIAGATVSGFETLTLGGAASMTAAQYNGFTSGAAAGGAADVLTITTAGSIAGSANIETYTFGLVGSTNEYTYAGGAASQFINGNTGADTVTYTTATLADDTIALGVGTDTLNIGVDTTAAAAFTLAAASPAGAAVTGVEIVNITVAQTVATALTMFNGVATVNASAAATVVLGTGGQTFVSSGAGVMNVTGSTGADTYTLGSTGADTVVLAPANSLGSAFDKITGFNAATDFIDTTTAAGANALTAQTIATADTAGLVAALGTAVSAAFTAANANYDAAGDTVIVTIAAGTAAGTYLVHNEGATQNGYVVAEDLVVQLIGTIGAITAANII